MSDTTSQAAPRIVIAGGGPAGMAAAIACRQKGWPVTLVERRTPPLDKACGEGLMPQGVAALRRLGIDPDGLDPQRSGRFLGIRYIQGAHEISADFEGEAYGIRRIVLAEALRARAEELGVRCVFGADLHLEASDKPRGKFGLGYEARINNVKEEADIIVLADGLHSPLSRHIGVKRRPPLGAPRRFGLRCHISRAPRSRHVEIYFGERCEIYVTPLGPELMGVAVLSSAQIRTLDEALEEHPDLKAYLRGAPRSTRRGAGPLGQQIRGRIPAGIFLLGDAAGYVDALTGEGISLAFETAYAAAEHIASGRATGQFRAVHARLTRTHRWLTHAILWATQVPFIRRRILPMLCADPQIFRQMVALNAGAIGLRDLQLSLIPRLLLGLRHAALPWGTSAGGDALAAPGAAPAAEGRADPDGQKKAS